MFLMVFMGECGRMVERTSGVGQGISKSMGGNSVIYCFIGA